MTKAEQRAAICAELTRLLGEERRRRKLSINEVSKRAGLSQSTVSRLEKYADNPTMDSLLRVADVLEINLGELLKRALKKHA